MSDETKADPFDSADLYTCCEDAEEYDAETPEEAIRQYSTAGYSQNAKPLIVYGRKRKTVTEEWITWEGQTLADRIVEDFQDEFGGDHGSTDFELLLTAAVRSAVEELSPFWCDPCGQREYSAEQVAEILGSK